MALIRGIAPLFVAWELWAERNKRRLGEGITNPDQMSNEDSKMDAGK